MPFLSSPHAVNADAPTPRSGRVAVGEAELAYSCEGAGPPVVLIHGWTLDQRMWAPQMAALRGGFQVVRYDRRGFGSSSGVPDARQDPVDLYVLLEHLGLRRAAIVGMSQGARAALNFACAHADRVSGLVLDGPPDMMDPQDISHPQAEDPQDFDDFTAIIHREGLDAFRAAWRRHPLMQLHQFHPEYASLIDAMIREYRGLDLLSPPPATAPEPAASTPQRLAVATLVMTGALDLTARRRAADRLAAALAKATRLEIAQAGHLANMDNPAAYNQALIEFLTRTLQSPLPP